MKAWKTIEDTKTLLDLHSKSDLWWNPFMIHVTPIESFTKDGKFYRLHRWGFVWSKSKDINDLWKLLSIHCYETIR